MAHSATINAREIAIIETWHSVLVWVMPRRPSTAHKIEIAQDPKNVLTFQSPVKLKNPAAVALGKLGGSKGGKARAANLSPEERKAIAIQGAKARWAKLSAKGLG